MAPKMLPINDFFYRAAGAVPTDRVPLLLELYSCYKALRAEAESLDEFIFWGDVILSDFNDVDKYLVDPRRLFTNVSEFKGMLSPVDYMSEAQLSAMSRFLSHFETGGRYKDSFRKLWDLLLPLYEGFNSSLKEKGMSYEGMVYRSLATRLEGESAADIFADSFPGTDRFVFVGLNALNECEKKLLRRLRDARLAEFCWDYSSSMIKDPANKSSLFLSENVLEFPQAFSPDPDGLISPSFHVLSVPSGVGQAKQLPQVLSRLPEASPGEETAVVLADEGLLIPVLNSIPEAVPDVNVTMGYPLSGSGLWTLMNDVAALQLHLRERNGEWYFYHRQLWSIFGNSLFKSVLGEEDRVRVAEIKAAGKYYVPASDLTGSWLLTLVFRPVAGDPLAADPAQCHALAEYLQAVVAGVASRLPCEEDDGFEIEKDFAREYYRLVGKMDSYSLALKPSNWFRLLSQLLSGVSVPFKGEPLKGLQVMGPLETRALDFKNLVILGCNEGVFPRRNVASSFIPPELRKGFSLPTYEYQDAVWAYYFYRMIQRAENVWMLYDSRTEVSRSGEESRYIKQLELHFGVPVERLVLKAPLSSPSVESDIRKTSEDIETLRGKYLSASALQNYLSCPASFYYHSVKGLREKEEVSESMDSGMIGNVFHEAMQIIYTTPSGRVTREHARRFLDHPDEVKEIVRSRIKEALHTFEVTGRNLIFEDMVCRYVRKVLERDIALMDSYSVDGFDVLGLELKVRDEIQGFRFIGYIDRLDSFREGEVRVVDYKTGKVSDEDFLISDANAEEVVRSLFGNDNSRRPKIALQLYLYDTFVRNDPSASKLIGKRRVVNSVYQTSRLFVREVENVDLSPKFCALMEDALSGLLREIADLSVPFRRTDDPKTCSWCDFKMICGRGR